MTGASGPGQMTCLIRRFNLASVARLNPFSTTDARRVAILTPGVAPHIQFAGRLTFEVAVMSTKARRVLV